VHLSRQFPRPAAAAAGAIALGVIAHASACAKAVGENGFVGAEDNGVPSDAGSAGADVVEASTVQPGTDTPPPAPADASPFVFADVSAPPPAHDASTAVSCTAQGLCVHTCDGGAHTTISGTVYDPAARNPLYDIAVYVPYQTPSPIATGASCYRCADLYSGGVIASALTDPAGRFTIVDAPDGQNVPLVVQIGKWRMQYVLPSVTACQDNPQPDRSLRLPRNHTEGDIPSIAVSTGGADSLECLLRRIGVDASEYVGGPGGAGRVHVFQGAGGSTTASPAPASPVSLWDSTADLMPYDIVALSCEGDETAQPNPPALHDYANLGGRVFASHFHYKWFTATGSPFGAENLATWTPGANSMGNPTFALVQTTLPGGAPFPKGQAMNAWLAQVGALAPGGELPILGARHNADVAAVNTPSTPWIVADSNASPPGATQYFSWDTPVGSAPEDRCGRVVYSDLHVGAASGDTIGGVCPASCADNDLSPQEKALEFMVFDLSSCLTPVNVPPPVPEAGPAPTPF